MKKVIFILSLAALSSCTTVKYLQVTDGSRSDGTLTMSYEYTELEVPQIQWEAAKRNAISRCQAWGYSGAEFFDAGTKNCIGRDGFTGQCDQWRVTYKVQCTK